MNEHLPGSDDDWEPNEEAVEWAKQFFAEIGVDGVWSPEGSGVTYVRQDENTFALVRMLDHPTAKSHHARFKKLFDAMGIIDRLGHYDMGTCRFLGIQAPQFTGVVDGCRLCTGGTDE